MDDVKNIEGIGEKISAKLQEIFQTGKLKTTELVRKSKNLEKYDIFLKIHGIGINKAIELVDKYNINTIDQLVEELKKNDQLLNSKQKIGLEYYKDIQLKIPRKEMEAHVRKINKLVKDSNIHSELVLKVVGSYRRGVEESGDIDVIAMVDKDIDITKRTKIFGKLIEYLKKSEYLVEDFAFGKKKYMGICKLNNKSHARRIDILMTSKDEYPFALLYFTGDFQINVALRKRANELGYKMNEYGLKGNNIPTLFSEKEIFNFLGYKYLNPKDRRIEKLQELS